MTTLWVLKGAHDAPGWKLLEKDSRSNDLDVVLFDRDAWAIVRADEAPTKYEGLVAGPPDAGLYLDNAGHPFYVAGGFQVKGPREVIASLGPEAAALLEKLGDPDLVLERLGRAF
jgi:hypothetical protein